jgi:cis-3-alkyl-4-acyloxetan-2-one decarboxylase
MTSMAVAVSSSGETWRGLYPFASQYLDLSGAKYHYVDEGVGPTLLLVHGNPTWSFHWRNLILALRSHCRLIAIDHIGCGLSDKPRDYPYRLSQHIENLGRLIEHLDLRDIALVAHDWGGAIGLGSVLPHRERFSRLVLLNTAAFRSRRIPWRIRICRTPAFGPLAVRGLNVFARAALSMAVEWPERMTAPVRAGYLAPYDSWAHRIAIQRFVDDIPLSPRQPSYATLLGIERGLQNLADMPTTLIWGMRDWCFTPYFLERFIEFFPRAEVHRLADAGHWVMEDACEQVVSIVERFVLAR